MTIDHAPHITYVPPSDTDEAAVRAIIRDVEKGFNDNDPELSTAHFARNATAVAVNGREIGGLAALVEAHEAGLRGPLRDATAHYKVEEVLFLGPDAAIAHKYAWSTADAAAEGQQPEMIALYVFARRDGRWWIIARQNTLVAS